MEYSSLSTIFSVMCRSRGVGGIGFPSNIGPDPLENHKATMPAFNVGPSSACQRNTI